MSEPRYVVLGVAHVRSGWFTEVARWSTSGSLPVEFVKCLSATELLAHADSGRAFSAALLDATLPVVDRDLIHHLARHHIPAFVVAGGVPDRDWGELGAAAVLPAALSPDELREALSAEAEPTNATAGALGEPVAQARAPGTPGHPDEAASSGPLIAVIGRSGAGTSTVAIALAQALAEQAAKDQRALGPVAHGRLAADPPPVVLADLALHAHHALLHDAGDVVPGLPELVDAHRNGTPGAAEVLSTTFEVPARGYRLLLGLRRHAGWTALPMRSLRAALDGLRHAAAAVVADVDADLEGETETGSFDVEDRNRLARMAVQHADAVIAVCQPHATGVHGVVVLLADLRAAGVDPARVVVVVNRAPRLPRRRAELARAIAALAAGATPSGSSDRSYAAMAFVPERRGLDDVHVAVARLPQALVRPLGEAVGLVLERAPRTDADGLTAPGHDGEPVPVRAGELGHWSDVDRG